MNKSDAIKNIPLWMMDEASVMRDNPELRPYGRGEHAVGSKTHGTDHYKWKIKDNVVLYWSYCGSCNQLRTKKIVGYGRDDEGYDTAFIRDIVKGGQMV